MASTIRIKRSAVPGKVPATSDLALGELGLNTFDGKLYTKKDDGSPSIVELSGGVGGGAGGAGPILEPAYLISEDVTLGTNKHGLSLSGVEIAASYSVTVPAGATWTIADL
jgi:hypothetical protein